MNNTVLVCLQFELSSTGHYFQVVCVFVHSSAVKVLILSAITEMKNKDRSLPYLWKKYSVHNHKFTVYILISRPVQEIRYEI
jgi:hypothetical protein